MVTTDRETVKMWVNDQMVDSSAWISFWPYLMVTVEKCLAPQETLTHTTVRSIMAVYDEIVDEVI